VLESVNARPSTHQHSSLPTKMSDEKASLWSRLTGKVASSVKPQENELARWRRTFDRYAKEEVDGKKWVLGVDRADADTSGHPSSSTLLHRPKKVSRASTGISTSRVCGRCNGADGSVSRS
jgi:hypothetical protein